MTLDPNAFLPTALAGKAQIITDPGNTFVSQVANILGTTAAGTAPTAATLVASALVHFDVVFLSGAATQSIVVTTADKVEIVDVIVRKSGAGVGNTVTVFNGGSPISDAIVAATDKAITRMGTNDPAFNTIAAGGTLTVTNTFAAGTILANVTVVARRL